MITVEELIISSLYHRLVLITVRRTPGGDTGSTDPSETAPGGSDVSQAVARTSRSRGRDEGADHARKSSQECYSETVVVAQAFATLDASELEGDAPAFASAKGLGYLYLGQLLPQLKNLGSSTASLSDPTSDSQLALISALSSSDPSSQIQITRNIRTITEDDETRLTHALVQSSSSKDEVAGERTDSLWSFENVSANRSAGQVVGAVNNPLVDLRSHDQFSIIRIEDRTDPDKPGALTMIQANGGTNGAVNGTGEDGVFDDGKGIEAVRLGRHGAMFVEAGDGTLVCREGYPVYGGSVGASSGYQSYGSPLSLNSECTASPPIPQGLLMTSGGRGTEVQDMDSGVWEMINSSLNSPKIASNGATVFQASPRKKADLIRRWNESSIDTDDDDLQPTKSLEGGSNSADLLGTYKLYNLSENGETVSGGSVNHPAIINKLDRPAINHVEDAGGLADALKPAAEVGFVIHRVEHPSVRFSELPSQGAEVRSHERRDFSEGRHVVPDVDGSGTTGSRIERLCAEIQSLTAAEQATLGELYAQIQTLRSSPGSPYAASSPASPKPNSGVASHQVRRSNEEDYELSAEQRLSGEIQSSAQSWRTTKEEQRCEDDASARWQQAGRLSQQAHSDIPYRDIVEVTSFSGTAGPSLGASLLRKSSERRSKSRQCRSERTSPTRLSVEGVSGFEYGRPRQDNISRSACASPTRLRFAIDSPDMGESPAWRGTRSARGSYDRYLDGSASTTTVGSSVGRLHEQMFGTYETLEFERFTDWMRDLPQGFHSVPLSDLAIPGSHISVAIDRDMRVDMDFSRCNYEMAGFLRRLPNLAIFNDFRSQMKAVWKAWMPKQCLSVREQLEAGSRYLDMRVSKYLSAFYGEHGLYTRQLRKYLKEVRLFMAEHPREVIIIHFELSPCLDRADKRRLVTVLFQIFGAKMASSGGGSIMPSLSALWSQGKQLIVYFSHADIPDVKNHIFGGLIWSDDTLDLLPLRRQTVEELVQGLEESYPVARLAVPQAIQNPESKWSDVFSHVVDVGSRLPQRLHVTKAVLAPDMTMVFGRFEHRSMRELAQHETCGALAQWLCSKSGFNIVAVDFVGMGSMVRRIIEMNKSPETIV